jgi:hypothetical protein
MLKDFVEVPNLLYQDDPFYVPQLTLERLDHLGRKNPYFKHAVHVFFIAYQDGRAAGRICAQIDELAQQENGPRLGHFGFIDAANENVLRNLLAQAETWLREHGAEKMVGPFSLTINDEIGVLIEGFDSPPRMMMNYAQTWTGKAIEHVGYQPAKDILAFHISCDQDLPPAALRLAQKAEAYPGVVLRSLDKPRITQDIGLLLDIFNDAWVNNWGFVPMTADEVHHLAKNLKPLIVPDLVYFAELNGTAAAMIVALPDLNEALQGLGGRLLPFGWAKLLWRLKFSGLSGARVLLMGVRPTVQQEFLGGALAIAVIVKLHQALRANGYKDVELSWILDDNKPMLRLAESIGAVPYKRYRMYEKDLASL